MARQLVGSVDAFEAELLCVSELNESGVICRCVFFDPDDLDAAYAELDERYIALTPFEGVLRLGTEVVAAVNDHDWPRFLALFSDSYVLVDHQPVGFGTMIGPPIAWVEQMSELVPDFQLRVTADYALDDHGGVFRVKWSGHNQEGGPIEGETVDVCLASSGLFQRREQYPVARLDEALARYDELRLS